MTIKQFTPDRIDEVAQMAAEVWGKEQGAHDAEAARLFCQHLSRYSLYSLPCPFDEEQAVLVGCRHVEVDVTQEARRVAIGKVVISADEQSTCMCYPGNLMEILIGLRMHVIE